MRHTERDVVLHAPQQQQGLSLAILRRQTDAGRDGIGRTAQADDGSADRYGPREQPGMAEDRVRDLRTPGADQAPQAHDLASPDDEADVLHMRRRDATQLQHHRAGRLVSPLEQGGEGPPHHELHDFRFRQIGDRSVRHETPVAQHRDAIRERPDLRHPVRDVDQRHTIGAQPAHHVEQSFGLLPGQRRRRLVEREQPHAGTQCPHDLQQLTMRRSERAGAHPWPDLPLQAEPGQQRAGARGQRRTVEQDAAAASDVADEQILRHRQVGQDVRLLMDDANTSGMGVGRRPQADCRAVDAKLAGVRLMHALDQPQQRGLARTVLADEGEDFAGPHLERDVRQRLHHAEALAGAANLEKGYFLQSLSL